MARRPRLTPEEEALWSQVAKSIRPLKRRTAAEEWEEAEQAAAQENPERKSKPKTKAKISVRQRAPLEPPAPAAAPPLESGRLADLDRRSAERLRRGQMPIEGLLDLHGHRQHEAEDELARFLAASQAAGKRCVLVITGKGRWGSESGVLRQRLQGWLNAAPNRGRVLAFSSAQPKHGGTGAFYILLKRLRG